jgi:hypothetical protein
LKAERVDEHLRLLAAVFDELATRKPAGLRYGVTRAGDGLSFTHVAAMDGPDNPLAALPSFQAFTRGVGDRCEEQPSAADVAVVGDYGLFGPVT